VSPEDDRWIQQQSLQSGSSGSSFQSERPACLQAVCLKEQRDGYIRKNVLETDKFPTAEFVPTKIEGLPKMIPFTGQAGVQITGNFTKYTA
jgi:hypothetical protein